LSVVANKAVRSVQFVLKPAHWDVSATSHPDAVLLNEAWLTAVLAGDGNPAGDMEA